MRTKKVPINAYKYSECIYRKRKSTTPPKKQREQIEKQRKIEIIEIKEKREKREKLEKIRPEAVEPKVRLLLCCVALFTLKI